ncbi:class IV adenylate cyclase [Thermofilum pendens]|uniref:Adenylate cyclase n=1 Tax=Thermofilum pendens (strain DSM 2475 / Hrk 5) TaxID=368408 RepID=A1RW68_THEPD|nr:class IV adenylate cyclase [Thermofilum pendens]ABL77448.1 adenylate cyclase [Thermofilum pendens Hrk 5]
MPREVEVKFRVEGHDVLRRKLREAGAAYVDTVDQVDIYFQHPCRDFASTDEALRLRVNYSGSGSYAELTYKGPKEGGWAKNREEIVARVEAAEALRKILERLGFSEVATLRKHREFYVLDGTEVSLDYVEGLGFFVEIEDKGGGVEALREVVSRLGLTGEPLPKTYLELYLEEKATRQRT